MNNHNLNVDLCIEDLSIMFPDDLTFCEHINKIVSNTNSKPGIIRNTFHDLSKEKFIVLYKLCVRTILDIVVLLFGHLILLCITKKFEKSKERLPNWFKG